MKPKALTSFWMLLIFVGSIHLSFTQNFPSAEIYTLNGERMDAQRITNDQKPMVVVFFKTNNNKCCDLLNTVYDAHKRVLEERGVKMIAICVDCTGNVSHVKPFVYGNDLNLEVYVDKSGDFKRAMGVRDAPFTILYDQHMQVYCKYDGYCASAGEMVCDKMNECLDKIASVH
jgi:peroxiredoxin